MMTGKKLFDDLLKGNVGPMYRAKWEDAMLKAYYRGRARGMTIFEMIQTVAAEFDREVQGENFEYILWGHTGYPCFWNIPQDGETPEECLRTQLRAFFTALPMEDRNDGE